MTWITKPKLHHPTLTTNKVGYTRRDYEGRISTLCEEPGSEVLHVDFGDPYTPSLRAEVMAWVQAHLADLWKEWHQWHA